MDKQTSITSTEKLLEVIRGKADKSPVPPAVRQDQVIFPKKERFRFPSLSGMSLQKTHVTGVYISVGFLYLVKTRKTITGQREISELRRFALPPETSRNTPEFSAFLRSSLKAVCGSPKQSDLWAGMSAVHIDFHHLRIPNVPKKDIANAVYWSVRKQAPFDEKEVALDFEVHGEVIDQEIQKLSVMAYTAPRGEIEELKNLFAEAGWPLKGIAVLPFATQNLFRAGLLIAGAGATAGLFIGNNFSRIDIYAGNNLVMTRDIKAGTGSIVESLVDAFNERKKDPLTSPMNVEQGRKIVLSLGGEAPPPGEERDGAELLNTVFNLEKGDVVTMIRPALERLTRQIERTFDYYTTTYAGSRIEKIYASSLIELYQSLVDYVSTQLGIPVFFLNPLAGEKEMVLLEAASLSLTEKIAFAPSIGLSFSDNSRTPNLLYTYKDEERAETVTRINRGIFTVFILLVFVCSGIFIYQNKMISRKRSSLAVSETELASLGTPASREELMSMAAAGDKEKKFLRSYAERNLYVLLLGELSALTPTGIRLVNLQIGPQKSEKKTEGVAGAGGGGEKTDAGLITMEGLVIGDRRFFETTLAAYALKLESSPFFRGVIITNSSIVPYLKGETLHFTLSMKREKDISG
ncbi:MAG: hypothetical protein M0P74_02650 [Syntrophales bacterium]|nr:hypothetical protein [Syntrophales bacterium]